MTFPLRSSTSFVTEAATSTLPILQTEATTQETMLSSEHSMLPLTTDDAMHKINLVTSLTSEAAASSMETTTLLPSTAAVLCAECDIHVLMDNDTKHLDHKMPTITFNGCHHVLLMCPPLHQFIVIYDATNVSQSKPTMSEGKVQGILTMFCTDHNVWHDGTGHNVTSIYCMSLTNTDGM